MNLGIVNIFVNRGPMGREINDTRTRVIPFVVFFPDGLFSVVDSLFGYSLGDKQSASYANMKYETSNQHLHNLDSRAGESGRNTLAFMSSFGSMLRKGECHISMKRLGFGKKLEKVHRDSHEIVRKSCLADHGVMMVTSNSPTVKQNNPPWNGR
jgi:hypothetical protein